MLVEAITKQVFHHITPLAVRHLKRPDLVPSEPLARKVLDQAAREFQVAPPITIHLSDPGLMASVWCLTREAYVVGVAGRAQREAVAAAVSRINQCPYCVTVHAGMYASTGADARQLEDPARLPPAIKAAHDWAAATLSPKSEILRQPGFPTADLPQIFGTAILYHYINRIVEVFLGKTPVALPGMATKQGSKLVRAILGVLATHLTRIDLAPGQCVARKEVDLPDEFIWARPNRAVANALAQFALAAEQAGQEAVPEEVRALVLDHLAGWQGEQAPMSRGWVEPLVNPIDEIHKPIARLALLAARAAYQVDDGVIMQVLAIMPGDRPLLHIVAWASFAATRRISQWLQPSLSTTGEPHE